MNSLSRRKMFAKNRRRRKLGLLAVLAVLIAGSAYVAVQASDGGLLAGGSSKEAAGSQSQETPSQPGDGANAGKAPAKARDKPNPGENLPDPEQPTPEAAAYAVLAPELPGT
ncbi:MAG TPA: hypothetical protein VIZ60_17360, partial [Rubrobacter sp.]